ncbi:D-isomer specific 2-hydroxyacid dehydrogenase family protein [Companilactobacillus insicii]|uniref:D-isomer specific 2-hydroxyacid dehydrogenase family protein n=1 Tax=Companilactobacillus insicii TaxID=1732567 RepID=UPI000F789F37|nr:D-isomer specific 2-hydroxyacid dehydrogenase family protein [Companilactobacillus insicii]
MSSILVYAPRKDEMPYFQNYKIDSSISTGYVSDELNLDSVEKSEGYTAVSIPGSNVVDEKVIQELHKNGVKFLAVRSIGFNNIDRKAAEENNIRVSNVTYSTNSVSDFAVMLILMSLRKVKSIIQRNNVQDFSLNGLQGKELRNLTVGIIGTGKIGETVARNLSGFGCKIIAYDLYPKNDLDDLLSYVSLDELLKQSDVISLHVPLFDSNYHIINSDSIDKMKDGVCLINCARGELIDTDALISGLESGKIGSAGLDVMEGELNIFHSDHKLDILHNHNISILRSFSNVILTPHISFYTDQAVSDMVNNSMNSLVSFIETGESPLEIK